ncbi:MAG: S8 family peptidase [Armatimonadota bacterium]
MKRAILVGVVTILSLCTLSSLTGAEQIEAVLVGFDGQPNAGLIEALGGEVDHIYRLIPALAARLPAGRDQELAQSRAVRFVEPDSRAAAVQELLPWGVDRLDSELLHASGNVGRGVKVAVVDTGIDYRHRDLKPNYAGGYDFAEDDNDPLDEHGHGSHCAGIIAGAENGVGIVGVAPQARLYAVKVLAKDGSGYYSDVIAGLEWCVENGMQIASMSFGAYDHSRALEMACEAASRAGLLLVAASGNEGRPQVMVPAKYDSVIAVGAVDQADEIPPWSNTGPEIELCAAGVNILSAYGGRYRALWGTSMACPHVSGTAALVLATRPGDADLNGDRRWQPDEVRQRLRATAQDAGPPGHDPFYGYGIVDAFAAGLTASRFVSVDKLSAPREILQGLPTTITVSLKNLLPHEQMVKVALRDATGGELIAEDLALLPPGQVARVAFPVHPAGIAPGEHILTASAVSELDAEGIEASSRALRVTVR